MKQSKRWYDYLWAASLMYLLLGLITMVLCKPRSWCVYCPMGTMTQMICQMRGDDRIV